jgi:hypothetical protein
LPPDHRGIILLSRRKFARQEPARITAARMTVVDTLELVNWLGDAPGGDCPRESRPFR